MSHTHTSKQLPVGMERVQALSSNLPEGVPDDIQWMPPGRHEIQAHKNGKPSTFTVLVDQTVAERMQSVLTDMNNKAEQGEGDRAYFDFNHDDREASAHPKAFYWAGDDPVSGGVRVKLEWTEQGRNGISGRAWRRFSPSFFITEKGEVSGAGVNMGGLVNRAAFKTISPIWSKESDISDPSQGVPVAAKLNELQITANSLNTRLQTLSEENGQLRSRIDEVEKLKSVRAKEIAAQQVEYAVQAGKIPRAPETVSRWTEAIVADAKVADLLDQIPVNTSLKRHHANQEMEKANNAPIPFVVEAKAYGDEQGITDIFQAQESFASTPRGRELYELFRSGYSQSKE